MSCEAWETDHLGREGRCGLPDGLRDLYRIHRVCATSTAADTLAIRSHIAYWSGCRVAESVAILPSRGSSYKVRRGGPKGDVLAVVRVTDPADHREGVRGWR